MQTLIMTLRLERNSVPLSAFLRVCILLGTKYCIVIIMFSIHALKGGQRSVSADRNASEDGSGRRKRYESGNG